MEKQDLKMVKMHFDKKKKFEAHSKECEYHILTCMKSLLYFLSLPN